MVQLRRESKEAVYQDTHKNIYEEKTYHYHNEEEFNKHKKEMEEQGYCCELKSGIEEYTMNGYKIASYYTKKTTEPIK